MKINSVLKRELDVAFSKRSQPLWFRILKYLVLGLILYLFWGSKWLFIVLLILFATAMVMHFWYRHKTNKWTKSYGLWKYHEPKSLK